MNCKSCQNYNTCSTICQDVLKYVEQDYIPLKEMMTPDGNMPIHGASFPVPVKTKKQLIIQLYFFDHRKQTEIAETVGVSRQYVSKIVIQVSNQIMG